MKWFQHKIDSGDDPLILELMAELGDQAYYIFFRLLEVMAREYRGHKWQPFSWDFLVKRVRKSRSILEHFFISVANYSRKAHLPAHFLLKKINNDNISINCPKLIEILDYYHRKKTPKLLQNKSKTTPKNFSTIEIDKERERDRERDISSYSEKKGLFKRNWKDCKICQGETEIVKCPKCFNKQPAKKICAYCNCDGYVPASKKQNNMTEIIPCQLCYDRDLKVSTGKVIEFERI